MSVAPLGEVENCGQGSHGLFPVLFLYSSAGHGLQANEGLDPSGIWPGRHVQVPASRVDPIGHDNTLGTRKITATRARSETIRPIHAMNRTIQWEGRRREGE